MSSVLAILPSVLSDGMTFAFAALGVAVIIGWGRVADLSPDAAFTSGAVGMWCASSHGVSGALAPLAGFASGSLVGITTASIVLARVPPLLASLVVLGLYYSVNWTILGAPLQTLTNAQAVLGPLSSQWQIAIMLVWLLPSFLGIRFFSTTTLGLRLRAVSENVNSTPNGRQLIWPATLTWLAIGNGMVGLAGAIFASKTFIVDINMGNGTLIYALSAFLLGWAALRFRDTPATVLFGAIVGAIVLHALLAIALSAGAPAQYLRAITALALLLCLFVAARGNRNALSGLRL